MAGSRALLALYAAFYLIISTACIDVEEQPLQCDQSSTTCEGGTASLPYSECCAFGNESFSINGTCYACAELLSFTASSFTVNEGDGFAKIPVQRLVTPNTNVLLFYLVIRNIDPPSAIAGIDYGQFPDSGVGLLNIHLAEDELVRNAGVFIFDDSLVEYNESFTVSIQPLSSSYMPIGIPSEPATVTIIDNDQVDIAVDPPGPVIVMEQTPSLVFTLNKTGQAARSVSVEIDLSDPELDLVSGTRLLTFAPNDVMMTIEIKVLDDNIVEATEDHLILLRVPEGETGVNLLQDSVIIRVEDDDFVSIGLSMAETRIEEADGTVRLRVIKTGANERPVAVRVFTESLSAQAEEDFTPVDRVLEFLPNVDDLTVEVSVFSDGVVEAEETFLVRLEVPPTETGVLLAINTTTVTMENSDRLVVGVVVGVDVSSVEVEEGDSVTLTVRSEEGALNRDVVISLSVPPGDVTVSPTVVTLSEGRLNGTVVISADDDMFFEGVESFVLMITSSDPDVEFSPSPLTVDIVIVDNDSPQLSFSQDVYKFNETDMIGVINVEFGALTDSAHRWTLTSVPITATEGVDYSSINAILEFDNFTRSRDVSFEIIDDVISEGLESFRLELRNVDGELETASSIVTIVDDEKLIVSFLGSLFTVSESETVFYLEINKSGITTTDIIVGILLNDITAEGGSDYGFFPTPVFLGVTVILADEMSVRYAIPIPDDDIVESVETFTASLQLVDNEDGAIILGDITGADINIEDNDKVRVFLTQVGGGVGEGVVAEAGSESERMLRFVVRRDETVTLERSVTVTLTTVDGTATAGSFDYEPFEMSFTFDPNGPVSSSIVTINVLDDLTVEATEHFIVKLVAPIDDSAVELPENDTVIYIIDDDKIIVDFLVTMYTVDEDVGVATVTLTKTGDNEIPVTVSVVTMTADDTAIAGMDYNATIQPAEIQTTQTQLPIEIPIVDDSILEIDESFTVILTVAGDDSNVILGPQNTARVTITDNDMVTVSFDESEYRGDEGDTLTVSLVLDGTLGEGRSVQVGVATEELTAATDDFSLTNTMFTFFPGDSSMSLLVSLVQDTMCEEPEEVFFVLLVTSDPDVSIGGRSSVIIVEDDVCGIEFMNDTVVDVQEPDDTPSALSLCVGLTGEFVLDRDVRFVALAEELRSLDINEQALADVDFKFDSTILTLPSTEPMVCFDVSILNDDRSEMREKFNVSIHPSPGVAMGRTTEVTVVIIDQEIIIVSLSSPSYTASESDGVLVVEIVVSPPPDPDRPTNVVLFTTTDGTAVAPDDYTRIDRTVALTSAVTSVSVEIVSDVEVEGSEVFTVAISLPETDIPLGVTLGDISVATVTIIDTGDVFVNDTIIGDPLFIVPISLAPDSHVFAETPSLCYEIHGASGTNFNLISDTCTSVNALYQTSTGNPDLNYISEIGVKAVDLNDECVTIRIAVSNNCIPEIQRGSDVINQTPRYDFAGISVRRSRSAVRVSVPNCASSQLVMWSKCRTVNDQPQLRFDITRGLNLNPTSHGLLGQFWNIPIRVTRFHFNGPVTYDLQRQELYLVEIQPDDPDNVRRFVAEFYPISWDQNRPEPCLYAGDQQGGTIREIKSFQDPVIENNYRLYRTSSLFDTSYRFSMFQSTLCDS